MTLDELLEPVSERAGVEGPEVVLSVTEHRGVIPQAEVFRKRIATADTTKYKVMEPLDIAYNPYLLWTGAVGQWLGSSAGVTSPVYECFRVREPHDARFIGLLLESGQLTPYFDSTAIGSIKRRRRTTVPVFLAAPVEVPEPEVQRRIVDLIGALDADISALTSEAGRVEDLVRVLRRQPVVGPEARLGDCLDGIDSGKSVLTSGEDPLDRAPRILKLSAVRPGAFDADEAKALPSSVDLPESARVHEGDVLITRSNTPDRVGYCARARDVPDDTYMPDLIWRLRPGPSLDPDYLEQFLASDLGRARVTSTATGTSASMRKINKAGLSGVLLPVPELDAQQAYADRCLTGARHRVALLNEASRLSRSRDRLLSRLLRGEVDLPDSYDDLVESA